MRVASKEDLDAVAGPFEAASGELLAMLPGLDTGVGLEVQMPEFEPRSLAGGDGEPSVPEEGRHPGEPDDARQREAEWTTPR
jgi:hypothetical protein